MDIREYRMSMLNRQIELMHKETKDRTEQAINDLEMIICDIRPYGRWWRAGYIKSLRIAIKALGTVESDTSTMDKDELFTGLDADRVIEICQAEKEGRCIILPTKRDEEIAAINRALGIELYDWQIAYIFGDSDYVMPGRGSGKTLSRILKTLISDGGPIHWYKNDLLDRNSTPSYVIWFNDFFSDIYYRLISSQTSLKLRKVYFTKEEADADQERGTYNEFSL